MTFQRKFLQERSGIPYYNKPGERGCEVIYYYCVIMLVNCAIITVGYSIYIVYDILLHQIEFY